MLELGVAMVQLASLPCGRSGSYIDGRSACIGCEKDTDSKLSVGR